MIRYLRAPGHIIGECHRAIPLFIAGGIDERNRFLLRYDLEQLQQIVPLFQLRPIALAKRRPAVGAMAILFPQLCAGSEVLEPDVDPRIPLTHTARPEPFDENPQPIIRLRRVIRSLKLDHDRPPPKDNRVGTHVLTAIARLNDGRASAGAF
jgi:hypothetical protein